MGKKYSLTAGKLLTEEANAKEKKGEYENFFCSELVAAAFKEVGFLSKDVAASNYWPVSFSQGKNLKLTNGAKLGLEMELSFDIVQQSGYN